MTTPRRSPKPAALLGATAVVTALALGGCAPTGEREVTRESSLSTVGPSTTVAGGTTTTTARGPRTIEVVVAGGDVVGGPRRETVALGEPVRLVVTADGDDEVHVHTYDLTAEVGPGRPAELTFNADIPGVHEVELERSHKRLLTLEVR